VSEPRFAKRGETHVERQRNFAASARATPSMTAMVAAGMVRNSVFGREASAHALCDPDTDVLGILVRYGRDAMAPACDGVVISLNSGEPETSR
jgi:hypothetical protein